MDKKYYIVQLTLTIIIFVMAVIDLIIVFVKSESYEPTWFDHFCSVATIMFLSAMMIMDYVHHLKIGKDNDGEDKHGRN